jgi:hypothetical protein
MFWHITGTLKKCESGGSSETEGPPAAVWEIGMPGTQLKGGAQPRIEKARADAFTEARQARFLGALASTCNIALSCREAKVSESTVRRHYCQDASFRAGWDEAVAGAYRNLELMLLERSLNGTTKTVTKADGSVDRTHDYPNAIALTLLRLHRDKAVPEEVESEEEEDIEEVRARILRRIERLRAD